MPAMSFEDKFREFIQVAVMCGRQHLGIEVTFEDMAAVLKSDRFLLSQAVSYGFYDKSSIRPLRAHFSGKDCPEAVDDGDDEKMPSVFWDMPSDVFVSKFRDEIEFAVECYRAMGTRIGPLETASYVATSPMTLGTLVLYSEHREREVADKDSPTRKDLYDLYWQVQFARSYQRNESKFSTLPGWEEENIPF
jgi:hypothetical protein